MIPDNLKEEMFKDDQIFISLNKDSCAIPKYNPASHYKDLTNSNYFRALIILRHYLKKISDYYFSNIVGAKNIDLFMITPSVSSPMGPGSDSEPLPIQFGKHVSNLVDSSQFGFEPILMNNIDKVYCYLPSMRGEDPDKRHLNQFFHCEAEILGDLDSLYPIIESYIKHLAATLLEMPRIINKISLNPEQTNLSLTKIMQSKTFPSISFDQAVSSLKKHGFESLINFTEHGRDISSEGEIKLANIFKFLTPFWIKNFDRDRVPFYQKPDENDADKVINGDLIFPPITQNSFGGEVVGCGERQNSSEEILESLNRQNISPLSYQWYIDLRDMPNYKTTSGFGLGLERFITWALCHDDIKDTILYPRLKNIKTYP